MDTGLNNTRNIQIPNYSGVNIQIFNPAVIADGSAMPNASVSSNTYNYATNPVQAYPPEYYMNNYAQNAMNSQNAQYYQNAQNIQNTNNNTTNTTINTVEKTIQTEQAEQVNQKSNKSKKQITELTDEYVKTLESYLNSQDEELRTIAAKEVLARMKEDKTRYNDPVLIALNNKMLKDPKQPIRFLAMGAIEAHYISGDKETIDTLNKIVSKRKSSNPMESTDSVKASNALVQLVKKTKEVEG